MKKWMAVATSALVVVLAFVWYTQDDPNQASREFYTKIAEGTRDSKRHKLPKAERRPNDWFYVQRAYPTGEISTAARLQAKEEMLDIIRTSSAEKRSAVVWNEAGPSNIPGRITDLVVHPTDSTTIYAASAAGGVFKTTDGGTTWTAVFDSTGIQSVGAIAIHPTNPDILYVGTGEANSSGDSYEGTGVYKSIDAGASWTYIGLPNSFHIGRIIIDPLRPDSIYVAVAGKLFGTNPDRGLYRSPDGGLTWDQLLFVSDSTSCIDVALHPSTGTVFAAMWERYRHPTYRMVGGPTSGLYRSPDFGGTWSVVGGGYPPQSPTLGRIGVSVDPLSDVAWSVVFDHPGNEVGIYWSPNLGLSWFSADMTDLSYFSGGFGWYFGQIRVVPGMPTRAYALGVNLYRTDDGGISWSEITWGTHADHHALYVSAANPNRVYDGNDGGVAISNSQGDGGTWSQKHDMPNTQFYAITIDPHNPLRLYGGTQDNGTMRTLTGSTDDWERIFGGDGFYTIVDHTVQTTIFCEYQWGNLYKSTDGGGNFSYSLSGVDYNNDRHNWNTPFAMDPVYHDILYYGSNKLYKSENGGDWWTAISGDLTNGPGPGNLTFGTITTMASSATDSQVVYVGTDDANVWVTTNGGVAWQNISATLPDRWVTRVAVDPSDAGIAYVTFSGYKASSWTPHIYRTTDYGATWADIGGNLADQPINDVIINPDIDSTLYIGTDFGVFFTSNLGQSWASLGTGLPIGPVHDLDFHPASGTLAAGTHGRSMYVTQIDCCACDCPWQADFDESAGIDAVDLAILIDIVYFGVSDIQDPVCPQTRADFNCDGFADAVDLSLLIDHVYFGGAGSCDPCTP